MLLQSIVNDSDTLLFLVDIGAPANLLDPKVARELGVAESDHLLQIGDRLLSINSKKRDSLAGYNELLSQEGEAVEIMLSRNGTIKRYLLMINKFSHVRTPTRTSTGR